MLKRRIRLFSYIRLEAIRHQRSIFSIIVEMFKLYVTTSIGPRYYLLAGMADKNMPWQDKCQYLNGFQYQQALDILNPKPYRKVTQNKLDEKALLNLANIPTATFVGFYHHVGGFDNNGQPLTNPAELANLLASYQGSKVCAKLTEGSGGTGFFAGKIQQDTAINSEIMVLALSGKSKKSLNQLLDDYTDLLTTEGLLFESYIEQHADYARFNPSSVNTVRTWVLQTKCGINVIGAYFRIGRNGSLTDNGDGGGIMCPIDIKTGILAKGLLTTTPHRNELKQHCDNQVQLEGVTLSGWQEIMACSCDTLRKLPYTHFVGLDVCMTVDGPLIIEVNVQPDKDGAAYAQIPSNLLAQAASELKEKSL